MIPIQFITHHTSDLSYEASAMAALEGGCRWIQLRMKEAADEEIKPIALRLKAACREAGATFVIDDRVALVKEIEADGVHLGKNDMSVEEARQVLGEGFLIGGTANTIDDIRSLHRASADYIGLGPFRFTTTKEKLSPLLGLEGYRQIMELVCREGINVPICAIGGIEGADVMPLMATGIDGIAVSGCICRAERPAEAMAALLHLDENKI